MLIAKEFVLKIQWELCLRNIESQIKLYTHTTSRNLKTMKIVKEKGTCLWLKGLPCLTYEIKFEPRIVKYKNGKTDSPWHMKTLNLPAKERAKARSKTFPGIAAAMADQWTNLV